MNIYDEKGNLVELNDFYSKKNYLDSGACANIYLIGDKCLKIYYEYCLEKNKLSEEIYKILKKINHPNMIKILDLYQTYDSRVKAYLTEYYKPDNINILEEDSEYTLNQMKELVELSRILAGNNIKIYDIKSTNAILTKDKIILIDPDLYKKDIDSLECFKHNIIQLKFLFENIYKEKLKLYIGKELKGINPYFILDELIYNLPNNEDISLALSEKLKNYKKPIDYFVKTKKKNLH